VVVRRRRRLLVGGRRLLGWIEWVVRIRSARWRSSALALSRLNALQRRRESFLELGTRYSRSDTISPNKAQNLEAIDVFIQSFQSL